MTPFRIEVAPDELTELRRRLRSTRWPEPATVDDWSQGVPLTHLRDLCRYWADEYDWAACERRLNAYPQQLVVIDGLAIHALHVRSPEPDALPLLLTHGWPGSVVEFLEVIEPLRRRFHLVIPSLPGYGWSGKPDAPGWSVQRTADAWAELMTTLGYDRFGAQGGDWGSAVTTELALRHPQRLVGVHLNMLFVGPPRGRTEFDERERSALARLEHYRRQDSAYAEVQRTRPQTIGYALADSPAGQCAWILDKFWSWSDCAGDPVRAFGPDRLLDIVSTYWFTNSAASSARLYWESFGRRDVTQVRVPAGVSLFPHDIAFPPRAWAEPHFADLRTWHELDAGGHFAAFERPETFVAEVQEFFEGL